MKAIVSIPCSRVQTIAAEDESGPFSGRGFFSSSRLVTDTSHGEHELEFRAPTASSAGNCGRSPVAERHPSCEASSSATAREIGCPVRCSTNSHWPAGLISRKT